MSAYMIFYQDEITDRDALNAYQAAAGPSVGAHKAIPRVVTESVQTIEGDWKPVRVVMLEFEDREKALAWYNSPEYSAVRGQRLGASKGAGILVDGFKMPGQ